MKEIKKVKIASSIIVTPPFGSTRVNAPYFPPLALPVLTACLRKAGFEVDQCDLNRRVHYDNFHSRKKRVSLKILDDQARVESFIKGGRDREMEGFADKIIDKTTWDSDILFVSTNSSPLSSTANAALVLTRRLKDRFHLPIVLGGIHRLSFDIFKLGHMYGFIDYFVDGAGEIASVELLKALNEGRSLKGIKGVVFYENEQLVHNGPGEHIKPVMPDFNGLDMELYYWEPSKKYMHSELKGFSDRMLILPFQFVWGCTNHCIFCRYSTSKLFFMKPKEAVECLKQLSEKYKTKYFFFLSNTINISNSYINELCDEIIKANLDIMWSDCARVNFLDRDTIFKMKKAGCISLIFGLESASERMLKYLEKNITLDEVRSVLGWCNEAGIWTGIEIIGGLPTETEQDIDNTLRFLNENAQRINCIYYNPFYLDVDSKLLLFPDRYGITNIKRNTQYATFGGDETSFRIYVYSFDEVGGHDWNGKTEQINHSIKRIRFESPFRQNIFRYEDTPFLFYLYSHTNDKELIKRLYSKTRRRVFRSLLYNPSKFRQVILPQIMGIRNMKELRYKIGMVVGKSS